jgi:aminoglycoside phosphotransferase (APT) family kinase protein
MRSEHFEAPSAEWQRAFEWIEKLLGGRIVAAEREARWRPAWHLDLEREGERLPLYFRGDRGDLDHGVYSLEYEMGVLETLGRHGLPVPRVYGFCPEPRGIVMERRPGRPDLGTAETDAEREAVLAEYVTSLARIHSVDPDEGVAIGMRLPESAEEIALGDLGHYEATFRRQKQRPEPLIEFCLRWLRRHVPRERTRVGLLHGDAGQFIFEQGHLTALLDFELAYLGDPLADLAAMRVRDLFEPLGDLPLAFERYAEATGEEIDRATLLYHTARFALYTPMTVAHVLADPPEAVDLCLYREWSVIVGRVGLEAMAERMGLEVAPIEVPEPSPSHRGSAYETLVRALGGEERLEDYERDKALRLGRYLREVDRYGDAIDAADLEEGSVILGERPASIEALDAALEDLVLESGPERETELLSYFLRRSRRAEILLQRSLRRLQRLSLQPVV